MNWIDVIDSAIKIGLGALIAGVVSMVSLRQAHRNERDKELRVHRIKTIERIAAYADEFFNAHVRLLSKIAWYAEATAQQEQAATDTLSEAIRERDDKLLAASDGLRIAASRLRLIGAWECVADLKRSADLVMKFRNGCAEENALPSSESIDTHRAEVERYQERVHRGLHDIYSRW